MESIEKDLFKRHDTNAGHFKAMKLYPPLLKALIRKNYIIPTPIQRQVIPLLLQSDINRDVVAMARTGSGKTASFTIPLIHRLQKHSAKMGPRGLILVPNRELAQQSLNYAETMAKFTDLRCITLYGGRSIHEELDALAINADIIIATPSRLLHILLEINNMDLLKSVQLLILDEADRLFEQKNVAKELSILLRYMSKHQTALFSATLPSHLIAFSKLDLISPHFIRLNVDTQLSPDLSTFFFLVPSENKQASLLFLLTHQSSPINNMDGGLIFAPTKHHVEYLCELLSSIGITNQACLYGSMDQEARENSVNAFRSKPSLYRFLIVTDVAARGLDLPGLNWILHYDFPNREKLFVHRAGRVARAGRPGIALSLVSTEELGYFFDLSKFLNKTPSNTNDSDALIIGAIPLSLLSEEQSRIDQKMNLHSSLSSMKKVTINANKKLNQMRILSSESSYSMSKEWIKQGKTMNVHPLFIHHCNNDNGMLKQIYMFKPSETVFDINNKENLSIKRRTAKPKQKNEEPSRLFEYSGRYRDSNFYLPNTSDDNSARTEKGLEIFQEMQKAVLDYNPDEHNGKLKKKKKVRLEIDGEEEDKILKMFKKKANGDAYATWKKKRNMPLPGRGEQEISKQDLDWINNQKKMDYRNHKEKRHKS